MLLSSLAANREEGSLHCHNVLISNPLGKSTRKRRWTPAWCRSGSQKQCKQHGWFPDSSKLSACAYVCMCVLRAQHRGSSVYAYAMLPRCDPVGRDACYLILFCSLFLIPLSLMETSLSVSVPLSRSPPPHLPSCAKWTLFSLERGRGSISDKQNFQFWDESLGVDHHDNHLQAITMCSRGWRRRRWERTKKREKERIRECKS